jgi:WD40 repeat protein
VAISGDGSRAVSGHHDDSAVWVWDLTTGAQLHRLEGHSELVRRVAVSRTGTRAVSGTDDLTVPVWDIVRANA